MLGKQQHYGRSLLHALGGQNRSQVKVIQQHLLCRKCVCGQRVWLTIRRQSLYPLFVWPIWSFGGFGGDEGSLVPVASASAQLTLMFYW